MFIKGPGSFFISLSLFSAVALMITRHAVPPGHKSIIYVRERKKKSKEAERKECLLHLRLQF